MRGNAVVAVCAVTLGACVLFPSLDDLQGACSLSAPFDADAGSPSWRVAGSAHLDGDYAVLTNPSETQAGLVAWTTPVDLTTTTLTFDLSLTDDGTTPGMGVAIGLLAGSAANVPCAPDYDLCFLGAGVSGVAVIVRTAQRDGRTPQVPFVAVVDTSADPVAPLTDGTYAPLPGTFVSAGAVDESAPPPDASWHAVTIAVANGAIDVSIDGVTYLSGVALPAAAPTSGVWAFGASTDQVGLGLLAHERAAIRNVNVAGPPCAKN